MAFPSTFADITNAVIVKARLDASLDTTSVHDWINQTYYQVVVETEANVTSATMVLAAGSAGYTLPAAVARVKQMAVTPFGGTVSDEPMTLTTLDEILHHRRNGGGTRDKPTQYTIVGINDLELWPTPAAADTITIYYAAYPTALSGNTDVPIIEEPYGSKVLEYGALVQAGDFKGDPSSADWENQYSQWMGRYQAHLIKKRGLQPGQFHQWGDGWSSNRDCW